MLIIQNNIFKLNFTNKLKLYSKNEFVRRKKYVKLYI